MLTRNRWKEMLLSLGTGQSMIPLGDNGAAVCGQLSRRIWTLRTPEAAKTTRRERQHSWLWSVLAASGRETTR